MVWHGVSAMGINKSSCINDAKNIVNHGTPNSQWYSKEPWGKHPGTQSRKLTNMWKENPHSQCKIHNSNGGFVIAMLAFFGGYIIYIHIYIIYVCRCISNQGPYKENTHLFLESSAAPSSANDLLMGSKTWTNPANTQGFGNPKSDTVGQTSAQTIWDGEKILKKYEKYERFTMKGRPVGLYPSILGSWAIGNPRWTT